jgi:hypothetical protein
MAHDPLARTDVGRAVPDPSLRYPRILLPAMAHLLSLGRPDWVDIAYGFCELLFLALGAYWLAQLLVRAGLHPLFAALYVVVPCSIISIDRMLVDLAVASLALGFAVYLASETRDDWKLYLILAAAALTRDTGFLLSAAYAIPLLSQRRYRRMAIFATALLPAVLWTLWVRRAIPGGAAFGSLAIYPFWGMLHAVLHPRTYAFSPPVVAVIVSLWWMQLAGVILAIALALGNVPRLGKDAVANACFLWACLAILLPPGVYDDPFAAPRVLAPLLMFQFLQKGDSTFWTRLPLLLVTPRVGLELAPQLLGILRGLVWHAR